MAINSEPKVKTMNDSVAVDTACSSACAPDTPKPKRLHSIRASSQWRIRVATSAKGIAISGTDHNDDLNARPACRPKLQYIALSAPAKDHDQSKRRLDAPQHGTRAACALAAARVPHFLARFVLVQSCSYCIDIDSPLRLREASRPISGPLTLITTPFAFCSVATLPPPTTASAAEPCEYSPTMSAGFRRFSTVPTKST